MSCDMSQCRTDLPRWTCKQCGEDFAVESAPPEIDAQGLFFVCPKCDKRNGLWKVGGQRAEDPLVLVQSDACKA